MDDKLREQLEKHRENRTAIKEKVERERLLRLTLEGDGPKRTAMLYEAEELRTLSELANNMLVLAQFNKADLTRPKELVKIAQRMRRAAVVRWLVIGDMTNAEVAKTFGYSEVRMSQIKREVLGPKKSRT